MKDRRFFLVVAAALAVFLSWLVFRPGDAPQETPHGAEATVAGSSPAVSSVSLPPSRPPPTAAPGLAGRIAAPPIPTPANGTGAPAAAARAIVPPVAGKLDPKTPEGTMVELGKVHRMIIDYHTVMHENPVGTNAEIMQAIMGGNAHQAMLGPPEGQVLNARHELVDPWGTPYFFHQLSRDHMEIHSAGPDRIMGTADDVVLP